MPSKTILDCDPVLREAWPKILKHVQHKYPSYRLHVVETHVAPEEQKQRFNQGRNGLGEIVNEDALITEADGTDRITPFNYYPSQGVKFDILCDLGYKVYEAPVMNTIAMMCTALGLQFCSPNMIFMRPK